MLQVRLLDEKMLALTSAGRISFYGPVPGQEAATIRQRLCVKFLRDWILSGVA